MSGFNPTVILSSNQMARTCLTALTTHPIKYVSGTICDRRKYKVQLMVLVFFRKVSGDSF